MAVDALGRSILVDHNRFFAGELGLRMALHAWDVGVSPR